MAFNRAEYQTEKGDMQAYAFPGGYPIYYLTRDGEVLCPKCANLPEVKQATDCPDDAQWELIGAECNWEDTALLCSHCGEQIESAYGGEESGAPNLDCTPLAELQAYCQEQSNPQPLREYAAIKARAIEARTAGRIAQALQWEKSLDNLYKLLPEALRW